MSTFRQSHFTTLQRDVLIILACVIAQAVYIIIAQDRVEGVGLPLDDAWIYQTYARNLAETGQWAFVPGVPSTGSTSVLWTFLIAPAYLLNLDPYWWTQSLGLLTLIAAALGAARMFEDDPPRTSLLIGLAVAVEWHLVWAAASGMETGLFAALLIWYWVWLRSHDPALVGHRWPDGLVAGLIGGLLMLTRPEGVLALAAVVLYGMLVPGIWWRRGLWLAAAGLGFLMLLGPFVAFNYTTSGAYLPNTSYAKQVEYAAARTRSFPQRWLEQAKVIVLGAQALLLPGLIYDLYRDIRYRSDLVSLVPWLWAILHLTAFALRLPVDYQHNRYAIPVVPLAVIYGIRGVLRLARPLAHRAAVRIPSMAWVASLVTLFPVVLVVLGAPAYASDVYFIDREMVAAARWIAENTDEETVIAAHDIGALGYYAPRPLVDLAGLVSPDVIPHMHDPDALMGYILSANAEYFVAFPGWPVYEIMLSSPHFCEVWSAEDDGDYVSEYALGPMTIYRVSPGGDCPTERNAEGPPQWVGFPSLALDVSLW